MQSSTRIMAYERQWGGARTKGNRIVIEKDGGFEIQTKDGSKTLYSKKGNGNTD